MATDQAIGIDHVRPGWRSVARYVVLAVVAFLVLFPIYTTVIAALKPGSKVLDRPLVPGNFTLQVLRDAWTEGRMGRYLWNSTVVAVVVTVAQLVTSVLAAYAFAFLRFPLKAFWFGVFLATLLVPAETTLVVNRRTIDSLGWLNTYRGLAVPFLATAFGTFLLRQVFLQIPSELREAATMDGLGHLGFLREVAVPLVRPTLGALALFSFLSSWNQYLWPNLITTREDMNTVQNGLRLLNSSVPDIQRFNVPIAGTIIAALPIALVLVIFQRQLVRGLTAGAVKG
ncbi:MAG: carbohydrate ABC transporter permease [Actinomycetota bacterium]|jgi:sn-glycerol 3-phosphate transport system permease protein